MNKYICYGVFCQYQTTGYRISTVLESDRQYYDDDDTYFYVGEIELPEVDRATLVNAGIKAIDDDIAALMLKVEAKRHEKQSLMAIEHKGDNNE